MVDPGSLEIGDAAVEVEQHRQQRPPVSPAGEQRARRPVRLAFDADAVVPGLALELQGQPARRIMGVDVDSRHAREACLQSGRRREAVGAPLAHDVAGAGEMGG